GVEVLRGADEVDQRHEVAEEADEETDAIGAKKPWPRVLGKERSDGSAAHHRDDRCEIAELHVALAIAVDVLDIPADKGSESSRAENRDHGCRVLTVPWPPPVRGPFQRRDR